MHFEQSFRCCVTKAKDRSGDISLIQVFRSNSAIFHPPEITVQVLLNHSFYKENHHKLKAKIKGCECYPFKSRNMIYS